VGPPNKLQAASCQENYLWISLIFILWDILGPGITTAGPADSKFSLSFRTGKLGQWL